MSILLRRIGLAVTVLALALPAVSPPAAAHVGAGWAFEWSSVWNLEGETIWGFVTNHLSSRRTEIQITATWTDEGEVMETISVAAMVGNLAAHATSPFQIFNPSPVEESWALTVTVDSSVATLTTPVGGMRFEPGAFVGAAIYEGQITNNGSVTAEDVRVYAYRTASANSVSDAAMSANIASIAPGATATYSITFNETRPGEFVRLIASTTGDGPFLTSWNNYFGDVGTSDFVSAISWMANEGITIGCGNANFCPKDPVTRAQMAVFLTRALELGDTSPAGFTDIGHLSPAFQDAINAVANAGIASGCATDPLRYCPGQTVTRGQMSKFIVNGYGDEGGKNIAPIEEPDPWIDDIGHFSEPYNNALGSAGITSGCATSHYCPMTNLTREQMAVFLQRASQLPDA